MLPEITLSLNWMDLRSHRALGNASISYFAKNIDFARPGAVPAVVFLLDCKAYGVEAPSALNGVFQLTIPLNV